MCKLRLLWMYVRNLFGFVCTSEIIFWFERKFFLKSKLPLDVAKVFLIWIFLMFQNVVQSTKDVYGVNLSDIPSEDDLAIYARWDKFPVVIGKW